MSEPNEEPFQELLEEIGCGDIDQEDGTEHVLLYRGSTNRSCSVCGEDIPGDSRDMDEGEQYLILREKPEDKPIPLVERTYHVDCWEEKQG
jgi:hypothetical protein